MYAAGLRYLIDNELFIKYNVKIIVTMLLISNVNVNAKDNDGKTALMYAADEYMIAAELIKSGADVNATDNNGMTALMYTAKKYGEEFEKFKYSERKEELIEKSKYSERKEELIAIGRELVKNGAIKMPDFMPEYADQIRIPPQEFHEHERIAECFQKAADQGYAKGQGLLARMYADGTGVAKDERKAAEWFQKAAEQGEAFAQSALGALYENGRGVPKDEGIAVEWYRKAAGQGFEPAKKALERLQ
jgi:hypothetical protein